MSARMRHAGLVLAVLLSTTVPASGAAAATFRVTTGDDTYDGACDAQCSVREAVGAANATVERDTILLPFGDLRLTRTGANEDAGATGDLDVTQSLDMRTDADRFPARAPERNLATLHAVALGDRLIDVHNGASLRLDDVRLEDGAVAGDGGAIRSTSLGTLSLTHVLMSDDRADTGVVADPGRGGAIAMFAGHLDLGGSVVGSGEAAPSGLGGGIYLGAGASAELENTTILSNAAGQGGGVYVAAGGAARVAFTTITANTGTPNAIGGDASDVTVRNSIATAQFASAAPTRQASCSGGMDSPTSYGGNVSEGCGFGAVNDVEVQNPYLVSGGGFNTCDRPWGGTLWIPVLEPGWCGSFVSPALDNAIGTCPAVDARGLRRPYGPACDSGAAETPYPVPQTVPATPQAPTADRTAPRLALPATLTLRGRTVAVRLRCPGGEASCRVRATLTSRRTTLASKAWTVHGGAARTAHLTLTGDGRRAFGRHTRLRTTLTVRTVDAAGNTRTQRRAATLRRGRA